MKRISNKALSPVVATALLLVVAVISVVGYQSWLVIYSSSTFAEIEQQSLDTSSIYLDKLIDDTLYIKSDFDGNLDFLKISAPQTGDIICEFGTNLESSIKGDARLLYSFDDGNAKDFSGYSNDGSLLGDVNCSVWSEEFGNRGCMFTGNYSEFITVGSDDSYFFNESFSIALWFNVVDLYSEGIFSLKNFLIARSNGYSRANYGINIFNETSIAFSKRNSTEPIRYYPSEVPNLIGDWKFVVYSYNHGNMSLFLDGNFIDSFWVDGFENNGGTLKIGGLINGADYGNTSFNGFIDEVGLYSKALSPQEINVLYKAKKSLTYEQILTDGIKEIDVSSCNLTIGRVYDIYGFSSEIVFREKILIR